MNYNDLSKPAVQQQFSKEIERLQQGDLVLPAVFVDDQIVSQGYVDYSTIAKAIETARSAGQPRS